MIFLETTVVNQQNCKFHLKEWLPDSGIQGLVFLLHGLADHGGRFSYVAEFFTRIGFAFIAPDLRGNGYSDGKRGHFDSFQQVMDDIDLLFQEAIEKYPGIPVFIYGQSMGGNLALNYGIRCNPAITGMISSSPWLRLSNPPPAIISSIGTVIGNIFPSFAIPNGINADDLCRDKNISNAYRNDPLVHGKISLSTFKIITRSGEWAIQNAAKINTPILLMHGTADRITSIDASRQFADGNSSCEFKTWEGFYHELHNEPERDEVIQFILNWVETKLTNQLP